MSVLKYASYLYVILVAAFLSMLVTSIIKYSFTQPTAIQTPQGGAGVDADAVRAEQAAALTKRNLFNADLALPPPPQGEENEDGYTPAAQFDGKLTGIIMSSDSEKHRVIITGGGDIFILTMNVPRDGFTLKSVANDSAVVEFGGMTYNLTLDSSVTHTASAEQPRRTARNTRPPTEQATPPATAATTEDGGTTNITLERGEIVEQLKDLNTVLRSLLVSPTYVDGDFQGYRVARMNNDSPMRALGLQQGDIINRINGEELTSPEILFGMLGKVDTLNAVSVDITRNGAKQTLFVEIQ